VSRLARPPDHPVAQGVNLASFFGESARSKPFCLIRIETPICPARAVGGPGGLMLGEPLRPMIERRSEPGTVWVVLSAPP